jgi:hypothetical protein
MLGRRFWNQPCNTSDLQNTKRGRETGCRTLAVLRTVFRTESSVDARKRNLIIVSETSYLGDEGFYHQRSPDRRLEIVSSLLRFWSSKLASCKCPAPAISILRPASLQTRLVQNADVSTYLSQVPLPSQRRDLCQSPQSTTMAFTIEIL